MAEQHNDEIDLTELVVKIRNVLTRNTLLIISFILGGLILGFTYYLLKPSTYSSQIAVRTGVLDKPLINVLNENLNRIIEEDNRSSLSSKLNIPLEIAEEVIEISFNATTEDGTFYLIAVESLSNEHWNTLENGILNYLASNEYIKKRINVNEERYKSYISKLDQEIRQLDSLKLTLGTAENSGNNSFIVMNPSDVYSTLINLYKQRQQYKEDLQFNTAVEIVENFEAYEQPVSPRPLFSMGVGALIGLVLACMIIAAKELDTYLKRYEG